MMFVTMFSACWRWNGRFSIDAGHNPPYRVAGSSPQAIEDANSMTLGIQARATYRTGKLVPGPGETLTSTATA